MWTDEAPGRPAKGGLGFVVWLPPGSPHGGLTGRFKYAERVVGLSELTFLSRSHSLITQLELLAAASPYASLPAACFADSDVIHFIDNTGALYGLVKGYSPVPDCMSIIRAFHVANLALRANVWFSYVASKANISDLPSRGALSEMAAALLRVAPRAPFSLLRDSVPLLFPSGDTDVAAVWAAVTAQLPPQPSGSGGASGRRTSGGAHRKRQRSRR